MGESAGATLAAGAAIRLRDIGERVLAGQLLIYPGLDPALDSVTWETLDGVLLVRDWGRHYWNQYLAGADPDTTLAAPLRVEDLTGLPPAHIFTAEFDPLRAEDEAYGRRLGAAGVSTRVRRYRGMVHGMLYQNGIAGETVALTEDLAATIRGEALRPRDMALDIPVTGGVER